MLSWFSTKSQLKLLAVKLPAGTLLIIVKINNIATIHVYTARLVPNARKSLAEITSRAGTLFIIIIIIAKVHFAIRILL